METSLIGKAVDFGSKEYGFDSRVSKYMRYNTNAYVINHVNLTIARKAVFTSIIFTRKTYPLVKLLHRLGCIHNFVVTTQTRAGARRKFITFSTFFYRNTVFFKDLRNVSTPSRRHTISLKALRIASSYLKASTLILSTPKGLLTHPEALRLHTGGLIVALLT